MGQKENLLVYIRSRFGTEPDYPWGEESDYAVLRHADTGKWYAVLMRLPAVRLGLSGKEKVEVINLKSDPMLILALLDHPAVFPGYHMNKKHWISIMLNGIFPDAELFPLVDFSHHLTEK